MPIPAHRMTARPVITARTIELHQPPQISRSQLVARPSLPPSADVIDAVAIAVVGRAGPYDGYSRSLTTAGGILISHRDLDLRLRQYVWRALAWSAFTGPEGWYVTQYAPVDSSVIIFAVLLTMAAINWLIVRRPSERLSQIEIRPDCLIVDGTDVFWRRHVGDEWPALQPDENDENLFRLCGIYGTRFVEYLTVRRFDEADRAPEVITAHLEDAFEQLWKG